MPTIIRKPVHTLIETRREVLHAISWQVHSSLWRPPTNILETDEHFIIKVEIAGMRDEDIEVAVEKNLLVISGNRSDMPEQRAYYHQMEIQSGKFEIMAELPASVNVEKTGAIYRLCTCKEAYLKATGKGLLLPLDQVEVQFDADGCSRLLSKDGREITKWQLQTFIPKPGYQCALCIEGNEGMALNIEDWNVP